MKRFLFVFILFNSLCSQSVESNHVGGPRDASIPGGYIGISYEIDTKKKIKGYYLFNKLLFDEYTVCLIWNFILKFWEWLQS